MFAINNGAEACRAALSNAALSKLNEFPTAIDSTAALNCERGALRVHSPAPGKESRAPLGLHSCAVH